MVSKRIRKQTKRYYFSVEGETEKWYLDWLQKKINENANLNYKVCFDIKVNKDPLDIVKNSINLWGGNVFHFFDFESLSHGHIKARDETFKRLKEASSIKGVSYKAAYSNFCFELWLLLHKKCLRRSFTDRKQYLVEINKTFNKKFADLREFKHRGNFCSILNVLTFSDFLQAIENSELILKDCEENGRRIKKYGFEFFENNPSTSVGTVLMWVLKDCGFKAPSKK